MADQHIDFSQYHHQTLPGLLQAGRGELLREQDLPTLGLSIEGESSSFSYRLRKGQFELLSGVGEAQLQVEISATDWSGLVQDLESVPSILYGGRLVGHTGDLMQFMRWDPVLRALYTGRPIYRPGEFLLRDADGVALDPLASFTLADEAQSMRSFLDAAGYLLVRDCFSEVEVAAFRQAADELAAAAQEGDQQSWWGKDDSGQAVLCRCLNGGSHQGFVGLYEHPAITALAALLPEGMRHDSPQQKDSITLVRKNPGVREGLSDLPWHRDCGMGGHATMCPTFIFSIYLYDATPEAGCLQFLPGSHRYAFGFVDTGNSVVPGAVTVPARAGDVTVHVGDVMHAAPAPDAGGEPHRQSVLLCYHPDFTHHRGERHYNDVLLGDEQGQVTHLRDRVKED